ncbi:LOW QUALITY PROTEIN: 1-phosphatidylinositol 4,5-bisphosphate phosphodiesterase eta-1 [Aplochiton taeniatus]
MSSWVVNRRGEPQYCHHFLTDNSIFQVERCMSVMQSGTQMVKLKAGSKGLVRLFYLDEHRSCIRWKPSRKSEKAKITIDSLYKVTEGRQSDIFHRHAEGSFDPACCFTVYHGNHMESLDLVTSNSEEARTWVTGLRYLMAGISDEDSLAKRQRTHDQYPFILDVRQTFEEADKNGDGFLNIEEIYQLLHKMNVNLPRRKVKQMFQEADTDDQQGTLTYEEFAVFYKMMSLRRDLFLLLMGYSDRKDHLTAEELANFLRNEQKMANVTPEYCLDVIDKFEPSEENKQKGVLGIEGFTSFMRSPTCDVFNPLHHGVNQDMEQPLCNYFIASSHNTYLTGDQLLSHSKTDMYAWVLQAGCRCVEVDCWDGPDGEPMVQHGYTLTSKITFKSVIETINKYAFINNQYPVLLSIENHCSIQQQKKIAQHLREILADKLHLGDGLNKESKTLPSPHYLQGKILIKGKRLPPYLSADVEEGEVSDDDSADEIEDDFKLKNSNSNGDQQVETQIRKKLDSLLKESQIGDKEDTDSFSIRALLRATHEGIQKNLRQGTRGVLKKSQSRSFISALKQKRHSKSRLKCQSGEEEEDGQESSGRERVGRKRKTMKLSRDLSELVVFTNSVASQECLDEGTPVDVLSFSETRAQSLVNHRGEQFLTFNQRQLSRINPSAYRIDSSNFNPQLYWNVGCQLVALNYQTEGRMMQLNRAKFMVNGGSGYVLKPPAMCNGSFNPFCDEPLPACPKKQLILKIISGQQLPKPPDSMLGDRGEIIDPFVEVEIIGLPADCCKEQTRVVDDNGFNPVWEETLSFTLHMAEVALVRFLVWDHDPIGRDFVGQRTVAFTSLMPGYRHVYLDGLTEASIFVHVSVQEIYGKWSPLVLNPSFTIMHFLGSNKGRQLRGFRGLFNRSSKTSVDTQSGPVLRKRSVSDHLLRRTASAPAKGRKKTKIATAESLASIADRKDSTGAGPSGEAVERRPPARAPLTHRPISMPLERLMQGQLTLCSPQQNQTELAADTVIGACPFPRSTSVDLIIESSAAHEPRMSTPSTNYTNGHHNPDPSEEASYFVIGRGDKEEEDSYHKATQQGRAKRSAKAEVNSVEIPTYCLGSPSENPQRKPIKPDISAHTTTYTAGPFAPSSTSSSSVPSVHPLSSVSMSHSRLKRPVSLQESTISRLIDNVSLSNTNDTCGSVSALIGQFDLTADQNGHTMVSNNTSTLPLSHLSNQKSSTPNNANMDHSRRFHEPRSSISSSFISPLKVTRTPHPVTSVSSHKATQKCNPTNHELLSPLSQQDPPEPLLFSSPETAEHEVYTILDEEVLSSVSVYNLKEKTIHSIQDESMQSHQRLSIGPSPLKAAFRLGTDAADGWGCIGGVGEKGGENIYENVYENVYDFIGPIPEPESGASRSYVCPAVNGERFLLCHDSAGSSLMEVELSVDEDRLEGSLTSPGREHARGARTSLTKRQALNQKDNSTSDFSLQSQPASSYKAHIQNASNPSHLQHTHSSPLNQPSYQQSPCHAVSNGALVQPSPFHRPFNPKLSNRSPLRLNSYPSPQSRPESYDSNRDFSRSLVQQRSYNHSPAPDRSYLQGALKDKPVESQGPFRNGSSLSPKCLPGLSGRAGRDLCSPSSEQGYDCFNPSAASSTSHYPQPQPKSLQTALELSLSRVLSQPHHQLPPAAPAKTCSGPSLAPPQLGPTGASKVTSPCKSKSLGDLTSEDISCNFQSKYNIISRSFITPSMRERRKVGGLTPLPYSADPLTEQLRKLVSLEGDYDERERPIPPHMSQVAPTPLPFQPQPSHKPPCAPRDPEDSPPPLTRRLSSRSQSRVRHINSRARERQQEALKPSSSSSVGGVVLRGKPASQNPPVNRHSTGSYIAGYLDHFEDRGLPEGSCASLQCGYGDHYSDHYHTDDSLLQTTSSHLSSEPEVYFLLRL